MCTEPIVIINPRYKKLAKEVHVRPSFYASEPDYRIVVPCGHCNECLKKRKGNWLLRSDYLMSSRKIDPKRCLFCTFTIKPAVYEEVKDKPYLAIRRFLDRLRHHPRFVIGESSRGNKLYRRVKFPYLFVVEFADGSRAAERGLPSTHRMHFHAILFNCPLYWWQVRDLWQGDYVDEEHGYYSGIGKAVCEPLRSFSGVHYVLKYMMKDNPFQQKLSKVDAKMNGKLFVSHRFGSLSKDDIKVMRANMLRGSKAFYAAFINNFSYPIPRYWKEKCFTKNEIKYFNCLYIPPLIWENILNKFPIGRYPQSLRVYVYTCQMEALYGKYKVEFYGNDVFDPQAKQAV